MTAAELIEELKKMPPDAEVRHLWDGGLRTSIDLVWLARSGVIATAEFGVPCYGTADRPHDAPTRAQEPYWYTPDER